MKNLILKVMLSCICLTMFTGLGFAASDTWDWSWSTTSATTGQFNSEPISPFLCLAGGNENFDGTTFSIGVGSPAQIGSFHTRTQDAICNNRIPIIVTTAHDGFFSGYTIGAADGITIKWRMIIRGDYSTSSIENFGFNFIGARGDIGVHFTTNSVWFGPGITDGDPTEEKEAVTYSVNTDTYHTWRFVIPAGTGGGTAEALLYKDENPTPIISLTSISTYQASYSDFPRWQWGNVATYGYAGNPCPVCSGTHMWLNDIRIEAGPWTPSHSNLVPVQVSPNGAVAVKLGLTRQFNASGGSSTITWSLSTNNLGSINTTAGAQVTFTASSSNIGTVTLTATDGLTSSSATIIVAAASAPLFQETGEYMLQDRRDVKLITTK